MSQILRIDSSSRVQGSHSREIADYFETAWLKKYPSDQITVRDLVKTALPHIADIAIAGFYTPKEQHTEAMKSATALSDELINELQSAEVLLI
jgi:FMN-dependent NADH-azoreductase